LRVDHKPFWGLYFCFSSSELSLFLSTDVSACLLWCHLEWLTACASARLLWCLPITIPARLAAFLRAYLFDCLPTYLSACLCVCPSALVSANDHTCAFDGWLPVFVPPCLSAFVPDNPPIYMPFCLPFCLFAFVSADYPTCFSHLVTQYLVYRVFVSQRHQHRTGLLICPPPLFLALSNSSFLKM
jgi:hypothetical protein